MGTAREGDTLFWKEEGFSTVGMALALLITLALIFTCAQVYEVSSASSQVQEVADAAALAAENTVAEFYIVVTICDAVTFTLSLTMLTALGLSVVCACIPPTAGLSRTLLEVADRLATARDSFYESAQESLDRLQLALPFLATVKAQEVLSANSVDGARYQGIVVLAPWEPTSDSPLSFEASDQAVEATQAEHEALIGATEETERAAEEANRWKEEAYRHDSGSQTAYCMYERASKLAGMRGADNPFFSSVETWSFSAALARAQAYYPARYRQEAPADSSAAEQANSALRKRFYAFAQQRISEGYVHETPDSFDALFPLLPKNTDEMRATELYHEAIYPRTQGADGALTLHAWQGCPGMAGTVGAGMGSIRDMDAAPGYATCPQCRFVPNSMGKVAAASTSIENGFEYHYQAVAKAAAEYQRVRAELDPLSQHVKEGAGALLDRISDGLSEACSKRISCVPPGSTGAIALIVDTGTAPTAFPSGFIASQGAGGLGVRAALAGATLVKENADEGGNVLTTFFDGLSAEGVGVHKGAQVVLDVWSGMLGVYAQGHDVLVRVVEEALDGIPLASASGLGSWAAQRLEETIAKVGFDPPDLRARKAVLVNTAHVLENDGSTFSACLLSVKRQVLASGADGIGLDGALSAVETAALDAIDDMNGDFQIATIVIIEGVVEIPVTVSLPPAVTGGLAQAISLGIDGLRSIVASWTGVRQWR